MRKFLSLILALALVLTTLALPVSAAQIGVGSNTYELGFEFDKNAPYYAGDEIIVSVVAATESTEALDGYTIGFTYDSTRLTAEAVGTAADVSKAGTVSLTSFEATEFVEGKATLGQVKFTVNNNSNVTSDLTLAFEENYTEVWCGQSVYGVGSGVTATNGTVDIDSASVSVVAALVGSEDFAVIADSYHNAEGITLKLVDQLGNLDYATVTGSADGNTTPVDITAEGVDVTVGDTYTVSYKMVGQAEATTKTFTLVAEDVEANLSIGDADVFATGVKPNEQVKFPVSIDFGEGTAKASMVTFKVADVDGLTLDQTVVEGENSVPVSYEDNDGYTIVKIGTESQNDEQMTGKLIDLTFTAGESYGEKTVTISDPTLAIYTTGVEVPDCEIAVQTASKNITVIPNDDFATVVANATAWTNDPAVNYATITKNADAADVVDVKYYYQATEASTEDLSALFVNEITEGKLTMEEEGYYYVVAKIGTIYQLVGTLAPGEGNWMDKTKPAFDESKITELESMDYKKPAGETIDLTGFATDVNGVTISYKLNGEGEWQNYEAAIELDAETDYKTIVLKATDTAGNSVEDSAELKYDASAPVLAQNFTVGEFVPETGRTVTITVSDEFATDSIGEVVVRKTNSGEAVDGDLTDENSSVVDSTFVEGTCTFIAANSGYYYVIATDKAGNETVYGEKITNTQATASDVLVATVSKDVPAKGLIAAEDITDDVKSNGTFTYLAIAVANADKGFVNEVTITGVEGTITATTEEPYVLTVANAGEKTLTVTTYEDGNRENNKVVKTYNFTIVDSQEAMKSADGNNRYTIADYALTKWQIADALVDVAPNAANVLAGGVLSGDLDGNLKFGPADLAAIINHFRAGERTGSYTFDIMGELKPASQE